MANEKGAGQKPKYKEKVKTKTIHRLIPIEKESEIQESIEKIVKPYLFVNKYGKEEETD